MLCEWLTSAFANLRQLLSPDKLDRGIYHKSHTLIPDNKCWFQHPCWSRLFVVPFSQTMDSANPSQVTVSTILYWSMIEGGLAVIAACLPTLRFLVGKISISSIVNSLRSVLSLDSVPTQRPQRSAALPIGPYTNIHADSSATSHTPIVIENDLGDGFETKGHGIHVARQLSQHASIVWIRSYSLYTERKDRRLRFLSQTILIYLEHWFHRFAGGWINLNVTLNLRLGLTEEIILNIWGFWRRFWPLLLLFVVWRSSAYEPCAISDSRV